jgi:peptide/nickel transport system ATP-binding protein
LDDDRLLSLKNLRVLFRTDEGEANAVHDVSFSIGRKETVALIGESGAGKSITGMALMGLIPRDPGLEIGGNVEFRRRDGSVVDLLRLSDRALRKIRGNEIAMIFQEPMSSLNPVYTVGDQIAASIVLHQRHGRKAARVEAADMLDRLGIPDPKARLDSFPHQISGGMAQRVMIAMALACRPSLLIADEPTTALDVTVQAQLLDLLRSLQDEMGMSILFITHNLGVAAELADRIAVMYAGRIVEESDAASLFSGPRMPYARELLASVPRIVLDDSPMRLSAIPGEVPSPYRQPAGCAFHPRCRYSEEGRCDMWVPPLEECAPKHNVRCLRWPELPVGAAA